MGLFGFGKKKEKKETACCCGTEVNNNCCCDTEAAGECCCTAEATHDCCCGTEVNNNCCCGSGSDAKETACCCGAPVDGICCIKVLGAGCKSCHDQFAYAKEAVKNLGLSVEVEYITDMEKVMDYGVMTMPAIVVNERVVAAGKVLKTGDVEKLLKR